MQVMVRITMQSGIIKEFDALIKEAKVEQNEDKRFELLHKAEDIMFTDSPLIPIIFPSASYLQKSSVSVSNSLLVLVQN